MAALLKRPAARKAGPRTDLLFSRLVDEIVEVLLEFGGSAHRDQVIRRIASRKGAIEVSDRLKRDVLDAFDLHLAGGGDRLPLLRLPFGEGSHRWALTQDAWRAGCERQRASEMAGVGMAYRSPAFAPATVAALG